jgi:hypothetical protein
LQPEEGDGIFERECRPVIEVLGRALKSQQLAKTILGPAHALYGARIVREAGGELVERLVTGTLISQPGAYFAKICARVERERSRPPRISLY